MVGFYKDQRSQGLCIISWIDAPSLVRREFTNIASFAIFWSSLFVSPIKIPLSLWELLYIDSRSWISWSIGKCIKHSDARLRISLGTLAVFVGSRRSIKNWRFLRIEMNHSLGSVIINSNQRMDGEGLAPTKTKVNRFTVCPLCCSGNHPFPWWRTRTSLMTSRCAVWSYHRNTLTGTRTPTHRLERAGI